MLDRNDVSCENLLPVYVPSTQPNGLQSRQPGHKRNVNRKLVHETHIISVKSAQEVRKQYSRNPGTSLKSLSVYSIFESFEYNTA